MRNTICLRGEEIRAGGRADNLAQMKDEIVFLQPLRGIGLDQRGSGTLEFFLDDASRQTFKVGIPNPTAGKLDQVVPVAGEGQLENHADHAIVEVFDLTLQALAAFEDQRFEDFFHRRTLEPHVSGSHVLKAGVNGARAEDVAKLVEANLFADIELDHYQDGAAEGRVREFDGDQGRKRLVGNFADGRRGDNGFAIHDP